MLQQLGSALEAHDADAVLATLADDVTLRVAVHDTPFEGRQTAAHILGAVLDGVLHDIAVTGTLQDADSAVLTFRTQVADHPDPAEGLLVVRTGTDGRIGDLTVFLRPLAALAALAEEMGKRLGRPRPA